MSHDAESPSPFGLAPKREVNTDMRTIALIVLCAFALGGAWLWVKFTLDQHSQNMTTLNTKFDALAASRDVDHDVLTGMASDLKTLLRDQRKTEDRPPR